jgi:ABC-2 type transport system ATP-binding protein
VLVRTAAPILDPAWDVGEPDLEDLILAYLGNDPGADRPALGVIR